MIPIARPDIREEEVAAVAEVLQSGMLASGPKVAAFEEEFAAYCGTRYAVATCNGTASLYAGMLAAGIGPKDEVIVPAFTFFATASSVSICGAKPVFADVHEETFTINPDSVVNLITDKTKAVMGVHLFGQPFDLSGILDICKDHNLMLFEDAAQAHGAEWHTRKVGSFGSFGSFSFYPTKNMTTGEGGIVTTNDPALAEKVRLLVNHGQSEKYLHTMIGYNLRMTDIGAAIGLVQLGRLEHYNEMRIRNARYYDRHIAAPGLSLPEVSPGVRHVYHQYVVRVREDCPFSRDELAAYLKDHGVGTAIHYPISLPKQPAYRGRAATCPVAEQLAAEVLSLPVHPGVGEEECATVARILNSIGKA